MFPEANPDVCMVLFPFVEDPKNIIPVPFISVVPVSSDPVFREITYVPFFKIPAVYRLEC